MADVILIDHQKMNAVKQEFAEASQKVRHLCSEINNHCAQLKGGGWVSEAANQWYRTMDQEVLPRMNRLTDALQHASDTVGGISQTFKRGEEEARGCIPNR